MIVMALPDIGPAKDSEPDLRLARKGDRQAAGRLMRRLLPRVRNLVRYLVRGDSEVDDMAQLSLIAILKGLKTYRGEGSLEAWADRITVRETLRYAKKRRSDRQRRDEMVPTLKVVRGEGERPDSYLDRRELARLLDVLPDEQRHAVVLHHALGMSVPEVAEELGVPFDTAKSRLRLAKKKLRQEGER